MRKFYQLMAVVLLVLGALFPTVVTYAQEVSNEDSTTTPIVAPANSEESKVEEVTPTPAPDKQEPAVPVRNLAVSQVLQNCVLRKLTVS